MKILKLNNVTGEKSEINFDTLIKELKNFNFINVNRKKVNFILLSNEKIYANICTYNRI